MVASECLFSERSMFDRNSWVINLTESSSSSRWRNFAWTLFGRATYSVCQWGLVSALVKIGGTGLLGRYALALAVTAPLSGLANLQLRSVYATGAAGEFSWATYVRVRVWVSVACVVILSVVSLGSSDLRAEAVLIMIVAMAKAIEMVSDLCFGVFQRHRAMQYFGRSLAIRGAASLAVVVAALRAGFTLELSLAGMLFVWIAIFALYDWPNAAALRVPDPVEHAASDRRIGLVWLALPMGVVILFDSLNQNVPVYAIEYFHSSSDLGIYAALTYAVRIGSNAIFSLAAPLISTMAQDYRADRQSSFVRMALILIALAVVVGIAGVIFAWLCGDAFLRLVYSEEVSEYSSVFVWVMFGGALQYLILMCNNVLTAARWLRVQLLIWVVATISTATAAWFYVPSEGILGATQAFVFGVGMGAVAASGLVAIVLSGTCRKQISHD